MLTNNRKANTKSLLVCGVVASLSIVIPRAARQLTSPRTTNATSYGSSSNKNLYLKNSLILQSFQDKTIAGKF